MRQHRLLEDSGSSASRKGPSSVAVIGRAPGGSVGVVELFHWSGSRVGFYRTAGPGRYFVELNDDPDKSQLEFAVDIGRIPVIETSFEPDTGSIRIRIAVDAPSDFLTRGGDDREIEASCDSYHKKFPWISRRSTVQAGFSKLSVEIEMPLEAAVLGKEIVLKSAALDGPLVRRVPSLALLRQSQGEWIAMSSPAELLIGERSSFRLLSATPPSLRADHASDSTTVRDGIRVVRVGDSQIQIETRGLWSTLSIADSGPNPVRLIEFENSSETISLTRKTEIQIDIRPQLAHGGESVVVEAGRELVASVSGGHGDDDLRLSYYALGIPGRTVIPITTQSDVRLPAEVTLSSLVVLEVTGAHARTVRREITPVTVIECDSPPFLEAAHWSRPMRLHSRTPFRIVEVTGDVLEFRREPSDSSAHREYNLWTRPKRVVGEKAHVNIRCIYDGPAAAAGATSVAAEVPLFWFEIRYDNAVVTATINEFSGQPVSVVLRTSVPDLSGFASWGGNDVAISRSRSASSDLTKSGLVGLRDPVTVSFSVRTDAGPPIGALQTLTISPFYAPVVFLPDGLRWRKGQPHLILVRDQRPGVCAELEEGQGGARIQIPLIGGVGIASPSQFPALLRLLDASGRPIRATVEGNQGAASISERREERPRRMFVWRWH